MDETGKTVKVSRTRTSTHYTDSFAFTKRTFPVALGYAMTAHKCQGATLRGTTILDVHKAFVPAIVYVMLSRAPSRDHLHILGGLTPDDFTPVSEEAFDAFMPAEDADPAAAEGSDGTSDDEED